MSLKRRVADELDLAYETLKLPENADLLQAAYDLMGGQEALEAQLEVEKANTRIKPAEPSGIFVGDSTAMVQAFADRGVNWTPGDDIKQALTDAGVL